MRARAWLAGRLGPPLLSLVSLTLALGLVECGFALLLQHPTLLRHLPANLRAHVRNYYLTYDRDLIQANPASARYDRELFYTLRPGNFRFKSREFDVEFQVNSKGLRDDRSALDSPDVIVLGDSFAMGWGVPQQAAFPARVAALSGLKLLNAGVSSYGTAREVKLLERLDTSKLRLLLVQYDENDYWENFTLERHGGVLPIRTAEQFAHTCKRVAADRRYYPGKHTFSIVRASLWPQASPLETPLPPAEQEARQFLYALRSSSVLQRQDVAVLAFELNPAGISDAGFPSALSAEIARERLPASLQRLHVIDFTLLLRSEHYFDLDDHLRESGHELVARELVKAMSRIGVDRAD